MPTWRSTATRLAARDLRVNPDNISMTTENADILFWARQQLGGDIPGLVELITRIRSLPDLADWVPKSNEIFILNLLNIGVALGRIDHESFSPLLKRIAVAFKITGKPDPGDTSELYAAALIRPWCDEIKYVSPKKEERTPDFDLKIGAELVEIEVTNAAQKHEQQYLMMAAQNMFVKLSSLGLKRHLTVYFLDMLSKDEEQAIIDAVHHASDLLSGVVVEENGRWSVIIGSDLREGSAVQLTADEPSWWPTQFATPAMFGGTSRIDMGARQVNQQSSVDIRWGLSTKAYINPIEKKASRYQGSGKHALIIALDATQLPGALGWYEQYLQDYLSIWTDIAGVLIFTMSSIIDPMGLAWEYRFFPNGHSLPASFLSQVKAGRTLVEYSQATTSNS